MNRQSMVARALLRSSSCLIRRQPPGRVSRGARAGDCALIQFIQTGAYLTVQSYGSRHFPPPCVVHNRQPQSSPRAWVCTHSGPGSRRTGKQLLAITPGEAQPVS